MTPANLQKVTVAALRWITAPRMVKRGGRIIMVGKDREDDRLWGALELHDVDTRGRVWWGAYRTSKTRRTAISEAIT